MGKSITLKARRAREQAQVPPRLGIRIVAVFIAIQLLLLAALLLIFPGSSASAALKGEVAVSTREGYARLVFTLAEETEADIRLNNGILIIAFRQAVDLSADRIPVGGANDGGARGVRPGGR